LARGAGDGKLGPRVLKVDEPNGAFVMEGTPNSRTLQAEINAGTLTPKEAIGVIETAAAKLDRLHTNPDKLGARLVHRDIKPDNLLVVRDTPTPALPNGPLQDVVPIDFGLALPPKSIVPDAYFAGTEAFSSPNQLSRGIVVPADDFFALARTAEAAGVTPKQLLHSARNGRLPAGFAAQVKKDFGFIATIKWLFGF